MDLISSGLGNASSILSLSLPQWSPRIHSLNRGSGLKAQFDTIKAWAAVLEFLDQCGCACLTSGTFWLYKIERLCGIIGKTSTSTSMRIVCAGA